MRSKTGRYTILGVLGVLLVVAVGGYFLGWWDSILSPGTAGPPQPTYPDPEDGYTCLPTCDETDGKFLSMPGENMASFGGESIVVWISVPSDAASFELGFFDGDSGRDNNGSNNLWAGNWDNTRTESTYTLYADPLKDGSGTTVVGTWHGNQNNMPNNDWYDVTLNNVPEAQGPSGHYFYRLECTRPVEGHGINALKLRSTGYLSTGQADLVDASFAIVGMLATTQDTPILYPEFRGDYRNLGPSTYNGDWQFYFYIPKDTVSLEFWDGDFDRGSSPSMAADTDDPNTEGTPPWASSYAVPERAGGRGNPADDYYHPIYRRNPAVWYELIDPEGVPIHTNAEPSGTEEWENFVVSTDPNVQADLHADRIIPGFYTWHIDGLDLHNTVWIRANYEITDEPPPPVWPEGTCPRTIGYWKNNVRKVLIQGRTRGVQESRESLEWALRNVALASPLFRSGIDVNAPVPIASPTRLTDQEANAILQRENGNSMLDRALQQNLAAWLNLGSGKIGPNTVVTLDVHGGTFHGTVWEALQEAQNIILNGGDLERAKDIADQINNGLLGEEAETSTCEDYTAVIPPNEQPPDYEDLPEAPTPEPPPNPTPAPEVTCDAPRVNTYNVENPTNNPFHGIKFEYQSGTEVRDGDFDEFTIVLTTEQAAALTNVPMEAKAATNVGQVTLENCAFDQPLPCAGEPVQDENGYFAFTFMGAEDNGDGTMTLTFHVYNFTSHGLSHATIGLPDGVEPTAPTGNYQSEVCP
jgi:hypothetical protein